MQSLQGYFLIATNKMVDPRFHEQVVFICTHSSEGAMGLTVNKPSGHSLEEVFKSANLPVVIDDFPPIYIGGPVEKESAFFLYSSDYDSVGHISVTDDIHMSRESKILEDIGRGVGPKDYLFILGYAGWGPGQLEAELAMNDWLTLPSEYSVLFETENDRKWREAAFINGIEISLYSDETGFA